MVFWRFYGRRENNIFGLKKRVHTQYGIEPFFSKLYFPDYFLPAPIGMFTFKNSELLLLPDILL